MAQEAAGLQSERNGMWSVKEVKDVRRREGTEAAWDVLVSWAGRHEDSWVARAKLSRPLQKEVRSMLERRRQEAAQGRAQGVEARRAMRAERRGMGRRAAVWRGRLPAEGVRRSGRVRAARAQLEGLEEAESGEEAEEEVSSGGEGSEQEGTASDGAGGAALPESYFEVEELLRTKGKGNKLQVLVRWAEAGAADSWEPVRLLSEDQQRLARGLASGKQRVRARLSQAEVRAAAEAAAKEEEAEAAAAEDGRRHRLAAEEEGRRERRRRREEEANERRRRAEELARARGGPRKQGGGVVKERRRSARRAPQG